MTYLFWGLFFVFVATSLLLVFLSIAAFILSTTRGYLPRLSKVVRNMAILFFMELTALIISVTYVTLKS